MALKQLFVQAYQALHGATDVPKVTVEELKKVLDAKKPVTLLDVREQSEWDICHIEGAVLMPMHDVPQRFKELDKTKPVAVYCHTGGRSARVVKFLRKEGFQDVVNVSGGIDSWADRIDPEMKKY